MASAKAKIEGVQTDIKRELRGASTSLKTDMTLLKKAVTKALGIRKVWIDYMILNKKSTLIILLFN